MLVVQIKIHAFFLLRRILLFFDDRSFVLRHCFVVVLKLHFRVPLDVALLLGFVLVAVLNGESLAAASPAMLVGAKLARNLDSTVVTLSTDVHEYTTPAPPLARQITLTMLWVDKHRPKRLADLSYDTDLTSRLRSLAAHPQQLPHLFVYGPSGAGKATRVACLLRELYGNAAQQLDQKTFTTPTKKQITIGLVTSKHYVMMSPSDAGLNDRFVIQQVIQDLASSGNVVSSTGNKPNYKTVVLNQVDKLSTQAQAALRRTMEKYSRTCRLILVGNGPIMDALQSRCLGLRVAAPPEHAIAQILTETARKESLTLPEAVAQATAKASRRNVRRAILMLEASHVAGRTQNKPFVDYVVATDWETYLEQVATDISQEQSPTRLLMVRDKLYELLVHCIPATVILETLVRLLCKNLDDSLKPSVMEWAALYQHRLAVTGTKDIFHLEAFVAKYMALYKEYLNELFA